MAIVNGELNWPGHYLSAYGIAQKQGYAGTEEEWLDSLKGADVELRYHDGLLQWKHDEAETWNTLNEFTTFQADIVRKAENAQSAADRANASAEEADKSTAAANTAAGNANTKAAAAQAAADSANAAKAGANTAAGNANTVAGLAKEQAQLAQGAANRADAATEQADAAASAANSAAEGANASKAAADIAAQNADTKAAAAQAGASAANTAATSANNASTAANSAATSATAAAQNARTQGDYAKGQGDRADELLGKIEETDVGGMAADILALQNGKADKTAVETALAAKADQTAVTNALAGKADLKNGKVPAAQLPEMNYDPSGSAAGVQRQLDVHLDDIANPHGVTAAQVGLGKALTLTGAVSASYNGTTARTVNIPAGKRTCRFVIGTSTAGWTANDCDYLCDGVDDQVEINAAVQALPEGGGDIQLLNGTYQISSKIEINKAGIDFLGNGTNTILKRLWDSTVYEGVLNLTAANCHIGRIQVDGNKQNYPNVRNYAIMLEGSTRSMISETVCVNSQVGIFLSEGSNQNQIFNNWLIDCGYSIRVEASQHNLISNNHCQNAARAISLNNGEYCSIIGNDCLDSQTMAIEIQSDSFYNQISNNICVNSGWYGIHISSSDSNTINGNFMTGHAQAGVAVWGNYNTTTGNCCRDNREGIVVTGSNNIISGNACTRGTGTSSDYESGQNTIRVDNNSQNNFIIGNLISGKNYSDAGGAGNTFVNNKYN